MKPSKHFALAAFLTMVAFSFEVSAQSIDVYTDAKSGFSIQKLPSWAFISDVETAKVELKDGKDTRSFLMSPRATITSTKSAATLKKWLRLSK